MVINKRYKNDGESVLKLNSLQKSMVRLVNKKIGSGEYVFEKIRCNYCKGNDFRCLSEKDRYGLNVSIVVCKNCGLVQINPRMNQKSYNDFYDKIYRKLYLGTDKPRKDFFKEQYLHGKRIYNHLSSVLHGEIKNKFIIEVGTGAGGILKYFKNKGNKVFGIDLDSEYAEYGRKKGIDIQIGTIKTLGNVIKDQIKVVGKKPCIVIYSDVLEHTLDPLKEMKELKKYLDRESLVFIAVPGIKNLYNSYNMDFLSSLQNAHTYYFSLKTLTNILNKAEYELVKGDETIEAVFRLKNVSKFGKFSKIGKISKDDMVGGKKLENDYEDCIRYLKRIEKEKSKLLNFHLIRFKLTKSFMKFLKKIHVFKIIQEIYYLLKKIRS